MAASFPSLDSTPRAFPLPSIAEDTLHYTLHLPSTSSSDPSALSHLITTHIQTLLPQPWIWNKDTWELKVSDNSSCKLEGTMRVGDAVDDEWLVVWLLREVSKKWNDLIISIRDTDGEFLLIEAANDLPSWVSPENAENRLWLKDGHLHLIPLSIRSSASGLPRRIPDDEEDTRDFDPEVYISEEDGLRSVRTGKYRAEKAMEDAVWERIACYPEALTTHHHRTKVYIPTSIAQALSTSPELVQRAVEGFYVRDPSQLRAAARMSHFKPSPSVLSSVRMTRAAYAQLQGQVFHPPRVFGVEWGVRDEQGKDEKRWRDLGVKLATGFEIMYKEGGKKGRSGEEGASIDELRGNADYLKFLETLKSAGYFGSELEGSEKWKVKEVEAAKGWRAARSSDTATQRPSFAHQVDSAIQASLSQLESSFTVPQDAPEDDASWLEVSPDELDEMMQRATGRSAKDGEAKDEGKKTEVGEEHGKALGDLAKKVEAFVGGKGDMDGARFADELSDEDMGDDSDDDSDDDDDDDDDEETKPKLTTEEQELRMQNLVKPLQADEWGIKTAPAPTTSRPAVTQITAPPEPPRQKMRPPVFAKQSYDGVISDSDDETEDEANLPPPGTLGRKIAEMKWSEGAPRMTEIDEAGEEVDGRKREFGLGDDIDEAMERAVWGEEEAPVVVDGEGDVDMGEEEAEFLKFSREALGISEDMWEGILSDRKGRGVFVPEVRDVEDVKQVNASKKGKTTPARASASKITVAPGQVAEATSEQTGDMNMDLDSFDKVMQAMDAELARKKGVTVVPPPTLASPSKAKPKGKGKGKQHSAKSLATLPSEADLNDMSEDELLAMDRELRAALKGAGEDDDLGDGDIEEAQGLEGEEKREYAMMRDFLESYRSQGGESGVIGNLFGRLGEK